MSKYFIFITEKKLVRIQSGKGDNKTEGKDFLKSLEQSSDSCMYRLIASNSLTLSEQDLVLETPTKPTFSSKWVNPQQALTVGELVELVKADYLSDDQEDKESGTKPRKLFDVLLKVTVYSICLNIEF